MAAGTNPRSPNDSCKVGSTVVVAVSGCPLGPDEVLEVAMTRVFAEVLVKTLDPQTGHE